MSTARDIGIPNVVLPEKDCDDDRCPFHGTLSVRGRIMQGIVISTKQRGAIVIRREYDFLIPKYNRYERRNTRQSAHLPDCLNHEINVGDTVRIGECRKLSKTISFVVIDKIKSGDA